MPVDFLTEEQKQRYGSYVSAIRVNTTGSVSSAARTGRNRKPGGGSRGQATNRDGRNQLRGLAYIFVPCSSEAISRDHSKMGAN